MANPRLAVSSSRSLLSARTAFYLLCRSRRFHSTPLFHLSEIPRPQPREPFTPQPLQRPVGVAQPPKPGQNTGKDPRTWREWLVQLFNYDNLLVRQRKLVHEAMTPYFRHWVDLKYEKGKSFVAPSRLFRAERALYFPNLHGRNLLRARKARTADSTSMLKGKISIVSVFCSNWAERQVATFVNKKKHRELNELLHQYSDGTPGGNGVLQKVYVGVEQDRFKSWLVWLFMPSLRRKVPNNLHARYLVVTRGLSDELREEMGMLNKIVGYVYLVDEECRIRWAGSGDASPAEKAALIKGARRLVEANNARGMEKTAEVNKIDAAAAAAGVGKENSTASTAATKATKGAGVATAAVS